MLKSTALRLSWLIAVAIALVAPRAHAQTIPFLDMAVSPQSQTAAPGESPFWDIILTNNNTDPAYLIFQGFDDGLGTVPDVSVPPYNFSPFGQQYTIAPGASLNIPNMFRTVIAPLAADASYTSTAEVTYDLYDGSAFTTPLLTDVAADGDWTLTIHPNGPAATPEPGSVALCAGMGLSYFSFRLRRKRSRKPE